MAKRGVHEDEQQQSFTVAGLAGLALLCGILLAVISSLAVHSEAVKTVDRLVRFELTYGPDEFVPTAETLFTGMLYVSGAVAFAGVVGIIATLTHHKAFVSCYVIMSVLLAVLVMVAGVELLQRRETVEPIVKSQVTDLCNGTTYLRLSMNMGCGWTSVFNLTQPPPCGTFCADRVQRLKQLDGCELLPLLCERFQYEELTPAQCDAAISQATEPMYVAAFGMTAFDGTSESCAQACDADIMCTSYMFSDASGTAKCVLGAAMSSSHLPPQWTPLPPAHVKAYFGGEPKCSQRTEAHVFWRFESFDFRMALITMMLGVGLGVSALGTCLFMYNINMRREGKPNACSLCFMMLCPCFASDYKRFTLGEDSDEEAAEAVSSRDMNFGPGGSGAPQAAASLVSGVGAHLQPQMTPLVAAVPGTSIAMPLSSVVAQLAY
jgi:hypothetical protein